MTTFEHAIRLLRNDIKQEETRTIHTYEKQRKGWLERRARRLESLREELVALENLSCTLCEHINHETIPVHGGETITLCRDCGKEL